MRNVTVVESRRRSPSSSSSCFMDKNSIPLTFVVLLFVCFDALTVIQSSATNQDTHDVVIDGRRHTESWTFSSTSGSSTSFINNDSIRQAKDLLISLGVPPSNLCVRTAGNEFVVESTTLGSLTVKPQNQLLPPCRQLEEDRTTTSTSTTTPTTELPMTRGLSSSSSSSSSWVNWIMIPRHERRRNLRRQRDLLSEGGTLEEEIHSFDDDPWFYLLHAAGAFACVTTAALAAGLTMGLLSLDPLMLLIKMRAGATQREKDQAAALLPIVKQHHLLLVTLLLLNSIANEALPLFLEVLVSPIVAVILSVTFVLFFGEIIPSAVFTGPQKIELASRMVPLVKVVMALLWLIAYPIAKVLDLILHEESDGAENMNRNELSALVRVQYEERMANKRARKMEKVKYQKQKGSFMSINAGGAATTATLTGRATPTDVVVSNVSQTAATANSRVESLNFSQPKNRRFDADAAIRASKHEQIVSEYSGLTNRSSTHDYETSVRSDQSADGRGSGMKRSNSIHIDEVTMVEGALSMKTLRAMDVLTPLHRIYAVPHDLILNEDNIVDIYSSGYSRIPVYQRNPNKPKSQASIIGLLMTKHLIVVSPNENRPLSTLPLQTPPCVSPKMNLIDLVNLFQTGQVGHLALVCARPRVGQDVLSAGHVLPSSAGLMGLITLEDVFEAILQEQIYDEMDPMEREAEKIARWVCRKWRNYKAVKVEESRRLAAMGDVVDELMRRNDSNSVGETSFLLGKHKKGIDTDSSGSGILGFFQSLGGSKHDDNK